MLPNIETFESRIKEILKTGLDKRLHYHGFHHVLYVLDAASEIASYSDLSDRERLMLKTAVLLHDAGFLRTYNEHEVAGTEIANEMLPEFGYTKSDIKIINGMIMATRIPQSPANHLEEIIADADLEYLGTDNFEKISEYLYMELIEYNYIRSREEWNQIQVRFLKSHRYFTEFCIQKKEPVKQKHLKKIINLID